VNNSLEFGGIEMRNLRIFLLIALVVAFGAFAQEVPDTPETPEPEPEVVAEPEPEVAAEPEPVASPEPVAENEPVVETEPAAASSLLFETTMDFELVKKTQLEGKVGEIEIKGIEFGSKSSKSGIFGTKDADLKASITAHVECSTTAPKKQKIDFMIQFLDGEGNIIDRAVGSGSLKDEVKTIEVDHTTLKYVFPQIKKVRISAESKAK